MHTARVKEVNDHQRRAKVPALPEIDIGPGRPYNSDRNIHFRHRKGAVKADFLSVAFLMTFLVGVSRIYLGVHYPTGFPEFTSDLLAHVMSGDQPHTGHNMGGTR